MLWEPFCSAPCEVASYPDGSANFWVGKDSSSALGRAFLDADAFVTEWLPDLHLHGTSESLESPKAKAKSLPKAKAQAKKPPISAVTLQKQDKNGRKALRDSFERVVIVHQKKQKNLLIGQYLTNGGFASTCMICGCVIYWAVSLFCSCC